MTEMTRRDSLHDEKHSSQQVIPQHNYQSRDQSSSKIWHSLVTRGGKHPWRCTVYHRLSTCVVVANLAIIVIMCLKTRLLGDPEACLQGVAASLLICVLVRLDQVVNLLYYLFGLIPHSIPFYIRRHAANLYHLGGIHSGTAVAAGFWLAIFHVAVIRSKESDVPWDAQTILTITLASLLDLLLLLMLLFSVPVLRHRYHNIWEGVHRLTGWLLVLVFWAYLASYSYLLSQSDSNNQMSLGRMFYANPVFYLLLAMTVSITAPWFRLRKLAPQYERLSDHAIQLHFEKWYVSPCKTPRFSTSPIIEWHAFAGIPSPEYKDHSVIISRAGDWTGSIIDCPPKHLYTKGSPAQGVLYMAKIFRSVLCVGTGSGIAPILGLLDIPGTKFRVLWSARDPENTYSKSVIDRIQRSDEDAIIIDTARSGRPDLIEQASQIYFSGGIEAVFVISNAKVTCQTVRGLQARGVPTYGPIFDS